MGHVQPESILVNAIRQEIEARFTGCLVLKIHGGPFQVAGIPDLLIFSDGKSYALEVKVQRPGESVERARKRVTPLQVNMIRRFRSNGIIADCVTSPAEALAVMTGKAVFLDTSKKPSNVIPLRRSSNDD